MEGQMIKLIIKTENDTDMLKIVDLIRDRISKEIKHIEIIDMEQLTQ